MDLGKRLTAEGFGTFWLVLAGCGSAVLAAGVPGTGIGWLGVALAFGLAVTTMGYALGPISGGHFNPAVTLGLWVGGRCPASDVLPYILAQLARLCRRRGAVCHGQRPGRLRCCGQRLRVQWLW